jgi:NADH:ubiquinone oxidoreductase subunit 3 (subunit A)
MSKTASLLFAVAAVVLMLATGVAISHNGWLAVILFILTFVVIGAGFIYRAKALKRK